MASRARRGLRLRCVVLILSLIGLRELIFNSISVSLKNGIAAGIGLFIAFIGLQQAGVIVKDPGTAVKLNAHFASPDLIVFFVGLLTTAVLQARRVRGSFCGASLSLQRWRLYSSLLCCTCRLAFPRPVM